MKLDTVIRTQFQVFCISYIVNCTGQKCYYGEKKFSGNATGRLIASLSRNATYEKRTRADLKKKAELAFDQMEAELMEAIRQHPELSSELRDVLAREREKVLPDDED